MTSSTVHPGVLPPELTVGAFSTNQALAAGLRRKALGELESAGELVHPMRGVYHWAHLTDDLQLRVDCLRLVVPPDAVITDRTAAWLHGAPRVLAPNDHIVPPAVSVFCPPGRRLRNGLVISGERRLLATDVQHVHDLRVTTPLRTACDLGRLLHPDQALAAMDALCRLAVFTVGDLCREAQRCKGFRGAVQLRALAPQVDPRSESPGEGASRRRWLAAGLPRPVLQHPVPAPGGGSYYLDMALPRLRFAAEYDGEEFHGPEQREHDERRRAWLRDAQGWVVIVLRRDNVFGQHQDADILLRRAYRDLLERRG
ncbi:type IV toxin-antitoxin system AbiEi family antitoxin domain-containing protein [Nocardioides pacificus]